VDHSRQQPQILLAPQKNEQLCIYYKQMRRSAADFEEPTPINTA
jgi:hypothetical protein